MAQQPPPDLHALLKRQLRKLGLSPDQAPDAATFRDLIDRVNRVYAEFDQDRYLLERSQDISLREMSELNAALNTSRARLISLLSLSSDWVWEQDCEGRFSFVSDELKTRSDIDHRALLGQRCGSEGPLRVEPSDLARLREHQQRREPFQQLTVELLVPDRPSRHLRISGEPLFEAGHFTGWRGVGSDVTAAVEAERKIQELARYDSLTGLPNRYMFMEELERALARARRYGHRYALLFIDLDRFKFVNDSLGHAAGDGLLRVISQRLSRLLREADLLGRLGGDEFVLLTEGAVDAASLHSLATRILDAATEPVQLEGRSVQVSVSIGIAMYPDDAQDGAQLLKAADTAMYQAKAKGKNTHHLFTADLAQRATQRMALEGELRQAIEGRQLLLHYQPQVDAQGGELIGMEALLRWQHPERGLLSPALFIDLAEDSGLIVPIGRWVLHAACAQMRAWRDAGLRPPRCSVNISVRQLTGDTLVNDVLSALRAADLDPSDLEVEVTESLLMADAQRASNALEQLHELGVHIAIDDFGTGYSSLSYLKHFPAQTLKIDRSFVRHLPDDADDIAITRAVVAMGHSLGMRVIAEGVETVEQQAFLREIGCDALQGYLFGRPVHPAELQPRLLEAAPARG